MKKETFIMVMFGKENLKFNRWNDWFEFRRKYEAEIGPIDDSKLSYYKINLYQYSNKFIKSKSPK